MDLKTWVSLQGISGREEPVRRYAYNYCVEKLGKENVRIDKMGNIIANKKGKNDKKVMVCAHMDEVGLMVIQANDDGLLRVRAIGGIDPRVLVSKRVKVGYGEKSVDGVIGAMAIHLQNQNDRKIALPIESLYVDIGAKDKEEALKVAPLGTPITFNTPYQPFGDGMAISRAFDDRVGCYTLARLLEADVENDTYFVFTNQEEVGCRGAKGAAKAVSPDVAIILEGTTANDFGDKPEVQKVCKLGKGVAISFMDNASIAQRDMFLAFKNLAKSKAINHQIKMSVSGGNEGGVTQQAGLGVKTCVLSVPCRYIHSPSTVCALADVDSQYELAKAYIEKKVEE